MWRLLGSLRLTVFLIAVLAGLLIIQGLIRFFQDSLSPEALYYLEVAGFDQAWRSGWFIFALGLLILNLICHAMAHFPEVREQARKQEPPRLGSDDYLWAEFKAQIPAEDFKEIVRKWAKPRTGEVSVLESGKDSLQLAAQQGRYSRVWMFLAHGAGLLVLVGAIWNVVCGFEARVSLDEGSRIGYVQWMSGRLPDWKPYQQSGQPLSGYYEPGFEMESRDFKIEYLPGSQRPKSFESRLHFFEGGNQVAIFPISPHRPIRFRGMSFHQIAYSDTGRPGAEIEITERQTGKTQSFTRASIGSSFVMEGARVKVADIRESVEDLGAAIQLEYHEKDRSPERFWIFQRHPSFDGIHRKESRYHFEVLELVRRFGTDYVIRRNPGDGLIWLGVGIFLLSLIVSLRSPFRRYWFIWTEKKVTVAGWSVMPWVFAAPFERRMKQFRARLAKRDRNAKLTRLETQHGER